MQHLKANSNNTLNVIWYNFKINTLAVKLIQSAMDWVNNVHYTSSLSDHNVVIESCELLELLESMCVIQQSNETWQQLGRWSSIQTGNINWLSMLVFIVDRNIICVLAENMDGECGADPQLTSIRICGKCRSVNMMTVRSCLVSSHRRYNDSDVKRIDRSANV